MYRICLVTVGVAVILSKKLVSLLVNYSLVIDDL